MNDCTRVACIDVVDSINSGRRLLDVTTRRKRCVFDVVSSYLKGRDTKISVLPTGLGVMTAIPCELFSRYGHELCHCDFQVLKIIKQRTNWETCSRNVQNWGWKSKFGMNYFKFGMN